MVESEVLASSGVTYDPYDKAVALDPWAIYRQLRDHAPAYHNEELDFWAVSRFEDVTKVLLDKENFISSHGTSLGIVQEGVDIPPGTVLMEDPPTHTIHRKLLSRMFTPRRIAELEQRTRAFCVELLDPLVGQDRWDFIDDLGRRVPTRVISMLVGIPQEDEESVRDRFGAKGEKHDVDWDEWFGGAVFKEYIEWRVDHPSDDIMTQLLHLEFEDEHGVVRHLTQQELLAYVNIVSAAGNETTRLMIGWAGKLLADHPDQRRLLVEDPSLIPAAVEEALRFEPPTLGAGRYVAHDVEVAGRTIPAGSALAVISASANRDERHIDDPDTFDVRRSARQHLTFGFGAHFCLGASLARLETRVVLEEVLRRFPDWEVDMSGASFRHSGAELRGWEALPVVIP
jgi:cytochrome P450